MKQIIRLTESDLHRVIKESVNKILREGYVSNDGNPMVGGYWWSSDIEGEMAVYPEDLPYILTENGYLGEEGSEEYQTVYNYFKEHEDDLIIHATLTVGEDTSTNYYQNDFEPDYDSIESVRDVINQCPIINEEAKKMLYEMIEKWAEDRENYSWEDEV